MRIATVEEVRDMFKTLYQAPSIESRKGGQTIQIQSVGLETIKLDRASAVVSRSSLHSLR